MFRTWGPAGQSSWLEAHSHCALLIECYLIDVTDQCVTVQVACRFFRLNWDEVWGVISRAVARGLDRKQERVIPAFGIDEKAFKKEHKYLTVGCNLERATIEHRAENRLAESLQDFWTRKDPNILGIPES